MMQTDTAYGRVLTRALWHTFRLPALMLLVILEPVVTFVLGALALLGVLTTILYWALKIPHFPGWTMLALSLGFGFASVGYQFLIRILSA